MELYDYQQEAIDLVRKEYARGHRKVVLQLPTGAGKTFIAMNIIQDAINKGSRVAFVVDGIELLEQASEAADNFGIRHGVIQGMHWRHAPDEALQICTIQTLKNRSKEFDFAIIDECHVTFKAQVEWMKKFDGEDYKKTYFLGLSATPWTKGMGKNWDSLVKTVETKDLIERGKLTPFRVFAPETPNLVGVTTTAGDYNQKQLGKVMNNSDLVANIVKTWKEKGEDRQTVVFCVNIAHAEEVNQQFVDAGVNCAVISSKTDPEERMSIVKRFKAGEITVVANCMVLTKGFDHPAVSCLVLARPTRSLMVHYQQIGRGIRTAEGKENCLIFDHAGNHLRLGFATDLTPSNLCDGTKTKASKKEKEERLPTECPKCKAVKPPKVLECPECGFVTKPPVIESEVTVDENGNLIEVVGKRSVSPEIKQKFYAELLYIANSRGYKEGWASWKHKERFGHFPAKKVGIRPAIPSDATFAYLKYLAIKSAYGQKKKMGVDTRQHARTG